MPPKQYPKKDLGALTPTTLRDYVRFNGGKTVIQHFRVLDGDGSGDLTIKEFAEGVKAMGFLNATHEECEFVWKWLDNDGSGIIPYKELDKKLRDRPVETEDETKEREAKEQRAADKAAAAAAAAKAAAEAAAAAELAAEKQAAADAKAAAKLAKKEAKASKKAKPDSPKPAKSPVTPKAKKASPIKMPPMPFTGFKGDEGYVRPTLAAHGFPLHAPQRNGATDEDSTVSSTKNRNKPLPRPVDGDEGFLKYTIGTASLSDVTGSQRDLSGAEEAIGRARDATSARLRPQLGSAEWRPTTGAPGAASVSTRLVSTRSDACEKAARELEAKRQAEAAKRERVRKLALRAAEEAEEFPLPTKYPEAPNWAGVPEHERKLNESIRLDNRTADMKAEEAKWELFMETVNTVGGGGISSLASHFFPAGADNGGVDRAEDGLWA